jgi:fructokinase
MNNEIYIGLDVGGTKTEAIICQVSKIKSQNAYEFHHRNSQKLYINVLANERISTDTHLPFTELVKNLSKLITNTFSKINLELGQISGIGIGLPGSVNPATQKMINGNSEVFIDEDIALSLKQELKADINIKVANDANCFALAEAAIGAGLEYGKTNGISFNDQIALGIILGTGTGGGLISQCHPFVGKDGGAIEIGHSLLYLDGKQCYCGAKGCAEEYLSGTALTKAHTQNIPAQEIFNKADSGDQESLQLVEAFQHNLKHFLANLTNLYNPHYFVLGGGVSKQDCLYEGLEQHLNDHAFLKNTNTKVYKHQVSDSAGSLGAVLLFNEEFN